MRGRLVTCALGGVMLHAAPALAQQADAPPPAETAPGQSVPEQSAPGGAAEPPSDVVITGQRRGSAVTDLAPIATFDASMIAATGATNTTELLRTIRGATQSADGSDPIFLLNAQRVSGYEEIGTLPPEAIEKVEVLPEPAALKFGFPPTRRVVNFITKRKFRQVSVKASGGTTTRAGSNTATANLGMTRLHDDSRMTLALELRHTDPVRQSDRTVLPNPDVPFDAIGNVIGVNGEIDPALSAAAGQVVTVAPVPEAVGERTTLSGYLPDANAPRLFDLGPYRTLAARNDALKAEAVLADKIGATLAGSLSLSAERVVEHSDYGPANAVLYVPAGNPFSPFAGPVLIDRYLVEADPLGQRQVTTTLHAGATLRGAVAGWRWDLTANLDNKQVDARTGHGIDVTAANAAIATGANPFAPLDASLLTGRLIDVSRQVTRSAGAKLVATNNPIRLPAGRVNITATIEAERASADSATRGSTVYALQIGRNRIEAGIAFDVPIASRREGVLGFAGELSLNASFRARSVGRVGTLTDSTFGMAWAPVNAIQLTATVKRSGTAPDLAQQSTPVLRVENAEVFDLTNGRTELVTATFGGNPDLAAEHRLVRSLGVTIKPFAKNETRLSATYETTTIRNQTGTVYATSPQTAAALPDLFVRDADGRLTGVSYRPTNFALERQRTLSMTINTYGQLGKPPPPPAPGAAPAKAGPPPGRPNYYGGIGPSIKFSDRLQLRPGTPEFDLLRGDSVSGAGTARAYGYAYGGISYLGNGLNFNGWYGGANRVRNADPASDLRFGPILKLNAGGFVSVHHFLKHVDWTSHMQLRIDVENLTDSRQRVRDGNGNVPNRYQPDLLDPIGRTVTLSLRKLF